MGTLDGFPALFAVSLAEGTRAAMIFIQCQGMIPGPRTCEARQTLLQSHIPDPEHSFLQEPLIAVHFLPV